MKAETKTKSLEVYVKCNFKDSTHRAIEHGTGIGDDPIRKITLSLPTEEEITEVLYNNSAGEWENMGYTMLDELRVEPTVEAILTLLKEKR